MNEDKAGNTANAGRPADRVIRSEEDAVIPGKPVTIAFQTMGFRGWTAGEVYLSNLFRSLSDTYGDRTRLVVLGDTAGCTPDAGDYLSLAGATLSPKTPQAGTVAWALNGSKKRFLSRDPALFGFLARHGVEVLFGPLVLYKDRRVATISYVPDLQHVDLPEMFSDKERLDRDRQFRKAARSSDRLLLGSESAVSSFRSFAPEHADKMRALHPISVIPASAYDRAPGGVLEQYSLPQRFIYLPNQFWKHKNHRCAFEAVKLLKETGLEVTLVCTGIAADYRHPSHFAKLFEYVAREGIRDNIVYLGLVPREQVFELIRQSLCVINPSLFEGWGTTVDEAVSLGKAVLLSDIPEHREHEAPSARYFNPSDVSEMAGVIRDAWQELSPGPDVTLEERARGEQPGRIKAYAHAFMRTVVEALEEKGLPAGLGMGVSA